jgi:hypothetical protein
MCAAPSVEEDAAADVDDSNRCSSRRQRRWFKRQWEDRREAMRDRMYPKCSVGLWMVLRRMPRLLIKMLKRSEDKSVESRMGCIMDFGVEKLCVMTYAIPWM